MVHQRVIELAYQSHMKHWRMSGHTGTGDKLAAVVTKEWQDSAQLEFPKRFVPEAKIADHLRERIDLVDLESAIAYELKVSPNNDHFEFYRDIFKVLVAKDHKFPQLKTFCFICPQITANRYDKEGLRRAVIE